MFEALCCALQPSALEQAMNVPQKMSTGEKRGQCMIQNMLLHPSLPHAMESVQEPSQALPLVRSSQRAVKKPKYNESPSDEPSDSSTSSSAGRSDDKNEHNAA